MINLLPLTNEKSEGQRNNMTFPGSATTRCKGFIRFFIAKLMELKAWNRFFKNPVTWSNVYLKLNE